jgi:hypothetical protein
MPSEVLEGVLKRQSHGKVASRPLRGPCGTSARRHIAKCNASTRRQMRALQSGQRSAGSCPFALVIKVSIMMSDSLLTVLELLSSLCTPNRVCALYARWHKRDLFSAYSSSLHARFLETPLQCRSCIGKLQNLP